LARKEVRNELEGLKKASTRYRSEIAALKRSLSDLEKRQGTLESGKVPRHSRVASEQSEGTSHRYSAKGLIKQRARLGLSGADLGRLLGVSTQTIYNWESEKARPRADKIKALAELRTLGKRHIKAMLAGTNNEPNEPRE
jgi:DNA-binding XRE family transcriptional regulator